MAIKTETITNDGGLLFTRTYSDENRYVVRDGIRYCEAVDPADLASERVYTEGDLIPYLEPTESDYAAAGRIMLGGDE